MSEQLWAGPVGDEDRYELHGIEGTGTEGHVWRATRHGTSETDMLRVALKEIHPARVALEGTTPEALVERWAGHAARMRDVRHSALAALGEPFEGPAPHVRGAADPDDRRIYLVMSWVEGQGLGDWLAETNPGLKTRLEVFLETAHALDQLHRHLLVHGDLKPSNVRVRRSSGTGGRSHGAVLVDFGFMRRITGERPSAVAGTSGYMAPELDSSDPSPYTALTDLYAFAGVLFFVLTGMEAPAEAGPDPAHGIYERLVAANIPVAIAEVLAEARQPDPAKRPADGCAMWLARLIHEARTSMVVPAPGPVPSRPPQASTVQDPSGSTKTFGPRPSPDPVIPVQPRRRRMGPWQWAVAGSAVVVAAAVAVASLLTGDGGGSPPAGAGESDQSGMTFAELDDLVGRDVVDARQALADRGTEVDVDEVIDRNVADNTVVDVKENPEDVVVLTVGRRPVTRYLDELDALDESGAHFSGDHSLSGRRYERAVQVPVAACGSDPTVVAYDLGRQYRQFVATAGLDDRADGDARLRIEVVVDEVVIEDVEVALDDPADFDVDVTGALRLELRVHVLPPGGGCDATVAAVLGDPHLVAVPWELTT